MIQTPCMIHRTILKRVKTYSRRQGPDRGVGGGLGGKGVSTAISNCSAKTSLTDEDGVHPPAVESSLEGFCDDIDEGARFAGKLNGILDGVL